MTTKEHRYTYSWHKTYSAAMEALEDYFATGEVSEGERPEIEHIRSIGGVRTSNPYRITLPVPGN